VKLYLNFAIISIISIKSIKMLITKASEYAILSLIIISKKQEPIGSEKLAKELNIPKSFLAKILQALAKNDILKSFKGVNGGFALAKDTNDISMLSVISSVEGKAPAVFECSPSINECPSNRAETCSIWPFLNKLQLKIDGFLENLSLADLIED